MRGKYFDASGEPIPSVRQVLRGMSGVGKTQIAVQYAHLNVDSYDLALFVRGGSRKAVHTSYAGLAEPLGLASAGVKDIREFLGRVDRLLLIFDDVEEDCLAEKLPPYGHILITSRSRRWRGTRNVHAVGVLTRRESIQLIHTRLPAAGRQEADGLAEDLGDLPVAIDFMVRRADMGQSLASLRRELAENPGMVTRKGYDGSPPIDEFWQREILRLAKRHPSAACLVRMVALLAPDWGIPHELFGVNPATLPAEMHVDAGCGIPWVDRAVGPAVPAGWFLDTAPDYLAMHKLVGLSVQHSMSAPERRRLRRSLVLLLHEAGLGGNADIGHSPQVWGWWSQMLPHIQILIDHPETADAIAGVDRPDDRAELAGKIAELADRSAAYLYLVGALDEAVELYRRTLAIFARLDGRDSVSAAEALRNLASALSACGAVEAAVRAAERVLAIDESRYSRDGHASTDSVIATDLRMLASALLDANDADGALRHALRSLGVLTGKELGGDRVSTGDAVAFDTAMAKAAEAGVQDVDRRGIRVDAVSDTLGLLAAIARQSRRATAAVTLLETAVELDEEHREGSKPRPAEADRLFQLAELVEEQGDPGRAAELSTQATKLAEAAFGREGPILTADLRRRRAMPLILPQEEPE